MAAEVLHDCWTKAERLAVEQHWSGKMTEASYKRRLAIRLEAKWPVRILRYCLKLYNNNLPIQVNNTREQICLISFLPQNSQKTNGLIKGETANISAYGSLFFCNYSFIPYEIFRMDIYPPAHDPLIITAQVVHCHLYPHKSQQERRAVGVRFLQISDEDRQYIRDNVSQYLKDMLIIEHQASMSS
ncbi:MAG: PilZ domain-containing protein [Deltaproteobacteria bacterium]|nr:PilZ domain-containing protein [Deltaproteobacteria bacterium]MBW2069675.1 PilZ domain-containing protein [Deltaproteobacteria bacterium]